LKAPFIPQYLLDKVSVVGRMQAVNQIVRSHNGHGLCSADGNFKSAQIDLAQVTLGHDGIGVLAVILQIVAGKALNRYTHAAAILHAFDKRCRQ